MPAGTCFLILMLFWLLPLAPARAEDPPAPPTTPAGRSSAPDDAATLRQAVFQCFQDGDYARAAELIEDHLKSAPNDPAMLYNLACARSRLGQLDDAASALLKALQAGFDDLDTLSDDPDLEALHDHPTFKAIFERLERDLHQDGRNVLDGWRSTHGEEHYRFEQDEDRRLAYATALDETSHREMKEMLQRQADQMIETLFDEPPRYYILIAVPTPEDARGLLPEGDNVGGIYKHAERRLIVRNIGGSLRHEFVHALHYAHMESLGLTTPHRMWVQEGLASLYEDYQWREDGSIRFLANNRHNVVQNRARRGRLTKWSDLFAMTGEQFMDRAGQIYPQVRSIFRFLADRGKLTIWYRAYVASFEEDPSGARALELAFEQPVEEVEKAWRTWVADQPRFDDLINPDDAALGIISEDGQASDGVLIAEILSGSAARRAGLRVGDVIVSIDGRSTRSPAELIGIIGSKRVGETVKVRIRRQEQYLTLAVTLRRRGLLR